MRATAAVEAALGVVEQCEARVHAFAYLDPERALAEAAAVDRRTPGPLSGLVLGVKDVFDTADQPSELGTPIYKGRQPMADAAAVALLRADGAVCLGKTVTAELATTHPGITTNPHRATHTPGGSSMGSAAGVAAGMFDFALGTQTAGSVVRPASFCGVFAFKPTFGLVATAGVKPVAPSLDTVGWFARDVELLERAFTSLTGRPPASPRAAPPRIALVRTEQWEACSPDARRVLEDAGSAFAAAGADVEERELPEAVVGLADEHPVVMDYEAAHALAYEHLAHRDELSEELRARLDRGRATEPTAYDAVVAHAARGRVALAAGFDSFDAIVTPAALGEAPEGLESTGDARLCRMWTLLGVPVIALPIGAGSTGLPVGVQLLGRAGGDAELLAVGSWLAERTISS